MPYCHFGGAVTLPRAVENESELCGGRLARSRDVNVLAGLVCALCVVYVLYMYSGVIVTVKVHADTGLLRHGTGA